MAKKSSTKKKFASKKTVKRTASKTQQKKAVKKAAVSKTKKKIVALSKKILASQSLKKTKKQKKTNLTVKELREFKQLLLNLRDRIVDEISFLAGDNLNRSQRDASGDLSSYSFHMADQGTDNFDRELALNLVSSEKDIIYEIDEALERIEMKTYGICEMTEEPIEKERLKVLPHVRLSVKAQSEIERGKTKYRPFGPTINASD